MASGQCGWLSAWRRGPVQVVHAVARLSQWLASVVRLQTSIARHLSKSQYGRRDAVKTEADPPSVNGPSAGGGVTMNGDVTSQDDALRLHDKASRLGVASPSPPKCRASPKPGRPAAGKYTVVTSNGTLLNCGESAPLLLLATCRVLLFTVVGVHPEEGVCPF